jgi:chemotaxis protein MotB
MTYGLTRGTLVVPLLAVLSLTACVSQSKYDDLEAQNRQLQQQNTALSQQLASEKTQLNRLQGAVKHVVNSDLLFPPGGWQMSAQGKQIIGKLAVQLAPTQQNKLWVDGYTDNAPVGPGLQREGVTSNTILSQKRAENVMEFLISQGVRPDMVAAKGFGDSHPIASNNAASGRAKNRRVELTLGGPRT